LIRGVGRRILIGKGERYGENGKKEVEKMRKR